MDYYIEEVRDFDDEEAKEWILWLAEDFPIHCLSLEEAGGLRAVFEREKNIEMLMKLRGGAPPPQPSSCPRM
jgi:hypothetical protein